ncbi:hypothetical protein AtNW77_Chr2g0236701 [Arabidopsis thaliana]
MIDLLRGCLARLEEVCTLLRRVDIIFNYPKRRFMQMEEGFY